jgi:hypothetical protein
MDELISIYTTPLSQITSSNLQELVKGKAVENIRLEFKLLVPRKGVWVRTDEFSARFDAHLAEENELRHLLDRRRLILERRESLLDRARRRFDTYTARSNADRADNRTAIGPLLERASFLVFPRDSCVTKKNSILSSKRAGRIGVRSCFLILAVLSCRSTKAPSFWPQQETSPFLKSTPGKCSFTQQRSRWITTGSPEYMLVNSLVICCCLSFMLAKCFNRWVLPGRFRLRRSSVHYSGQMAQSSARVGFLTSWIRTRR